MQYENLLVIAPFPMFGPSGATNIVAPEGKKRKFVLLSSVFLFQGYTSYADRVMVKFVYEDRE